MLTLALLAPVGLHIGLAGITLAVKLRTACRELGVDSTMPIHQQLRACNEAMGLQPSGTLLAQADELAVQLGLTFDAPPQPASTASPQPASTASPQPASTAPPPPRDPMLPKMAVFDLDYTLWHPELYQLSSGPPFMTAADGCVLTARGERLELFPAARSALCELADAGVPIAIASRASEREWAMEIMRLLRVDEKRTLSEIVGDSPVVIQGGSKVKHLRHVAAESGVPLHEMIFFDNERTNIQEVEKIGPTCVYCPRGFKDGVYQDGMAAHADRVGTSGRQRDTDDGGAGEEEPRLSGKRARQAAAARSKSGENKAKGRRGGRGR